jgi:exosome complex exonuclease RRP6
MPDKQYQLSDWRVRPLTPELINYAREDTHYLLYAYDRLRMDLQLKGLQVNASNSSAPLKSVLQKSREIASKTYEKPKVKDLNYYMIIGRNNALQSMN